MGMPIVVQKYGGSSVADVEKMQRVAEKVVQTKRAGDDVVVVVSAMGKTTDSLLSLARSVDPDPPRRELDMLLSTGERISMALLSMAIQKHGVDAISFTGSQSGIITNDRHFDAKIIDVRPHRIEDELVRGRVVIIAGFQGMSYRREITTLGRGGSDTTALAMAAALGAERAEIYSDVDGVYSADPRVVPDARHLPEISYDAMASMASTGAKVLHAGAVEFARKAGITIRARSTFSPGRETLVHREASPTRAVVGARGLRITSCPSADLSAALTMLGEHGVQVRDVRIDERGAHFLVDEAKSPQWGVAAELLRQQHGGQTHALCGSVSVVGAGETSLGALLECARGPVLHARGADGLLTVHVEDEFTDELVRRAHDTFVSTP